MRRCTTKLIQRISNLTNSVFKKAVIEIMDAEDMEELPLLELMNSLRKTDLFHALGALSDEEAKNLNEKKQLIDDLYLDKMMTLSTKDLTDILFLHEHNRPSRAERTLEAITSELTRRSILDDSSQSDAMYSNGDVDVKRKSKVARKKTASKKRKTNKVR